MGSIRYPGSTALLEACIQGALSEHPLYDALERTLLALFDLRNGP